MTRTTLALALALLMPLGALAVAGPGAPQAQGASQEALQEQGNPAGVEQGAAPSSASKAHARTKRSVRGGRGVRHAPRGYGFLPGYEPPPRVGPVDGPSEAYQYGRGGRYWYRGRWYYGWGGPGFYRGRWNGGGFGPCWTETPIGPMWNCGR